MPPASAGNRSLNLQTDEPDTLLNCQPTEQVIGILREQEAGSRTANVCRKRGISSATFYKWKAKYGDLEVSDAKRLKALEDENVKLKKLLAEAMLDNGGGLGAQVTSACTGCFRRRLELTAYWPRCR